MAQFQKTTELRSMSEADLRTLSVDLEKQLFELRNQKGRDGRLADSSRMRLTRRHRARVLTILAEKTNVSA
jgi:ribosomal protein L29